MMPPNNPSAIAPISLDPDRSSLTFHFDNSYVGLPERFYSRGTQSR